MIVKGWAVRAHDAAVFQVNQDPALSVSFVDTPRISLTLERDREADRAGQQLVIEMDRSEAVHLRTLIDRGLSATEE
jgi:hypothetical protein